MNQVQELKSFKCLCRICLTRSRNMIPLNTNLEGVERDLIIDVLEKFMDAKVIWSGGYPEVICPMCVGLLKISYNLKIQFKNTENLLREHFKEGRLDDNVDQQLKLDPPVEIIVGSDKYDLKDILIVEKNEPVRGNFKGFLNNLGKTVTAEFVEKSKHFPRYSLSEDKPVVMIEKLKPKEIIKPSPKCVDKLIEEADEFNAVEIEIPENLMKLNGNDPTDLDREMFQRALNIRYKCNFCNKLYSNKVRLKKHLQICEKSQGDKIKYGKMFKCEQCRSTFKEKKFLNYHMKTYHDSDPLKYKCEICGEVLRNKNVLAYHKLRKHSEPRFVCNVCGKKFYVLKSLKVHMCHHSEQKVAECVCPVCGKTFHYKGGLFYHMKLHTNERKYSCEFCNKTFYSIYAKKRHVMTHTCIRPYPCKYCEKRFCSTSDRRKHEYIHTGERPYRCQYCNKGCASSYNLKVHLVSHPGPYPCRFCPRTFIAKNVLQFHEKTKHIATEEDERYIAADNEVLS